MAVLGDDDDDEQESIAVARGGPIYISNVISPVASVPDFQASLLLQLQLNLNTELPQQEEEEDDSSCSPHCNDHDLSVDELKIFSEEELVDMALKEAFKKNGDDNSTGNNSTFSSNQNGSHSGTVRKRIKVNKHAVDDESYLMKLDELVELKQKQDQDKATVRLHPFNCKNNDHGAPSSDTIKTMQSLRSTNFGKQVQQLKSSDIHDHTAVRLPEVVLCVGIYHHKKRWMKTQAFLVLGRQILSEMSDKIYCLMDQLLTLSNESAKLMKDVFCNDLRDASAIDYSEPNIDWLRNSKDDALRKWKSIITGDLPQKQKAVVGELTNPSLPQFRCVDMHKTWFCDLRFCLGAGYLYCHQVLLHNAKLPLFSMPNSYLASADGLVLHVGARHCKHTIVIRDMRLLHPDDIQNRAAYLIVIFKMKLRFQICMICKIYRATKVTVNDKLAPDDPCYLCNNCYYLLCYSEDGSLLYTNFSVYVYVHD